MVLPSVFQCLHYTMVNYWDIEYPSIYVDEAKTVSFTIVVGPCHQYCYRCRLHRYFCRIREERSRLFRLLVFHLSVDTHNVVCAHGIGIPNVKIIDV